MPTADALADHPPQPEAPLSVLVASSGGHLAQLVEIASRLDPTPERIMWCTYSSGLQMIADRGDPSLPVFHPSTRNIPNAILNYQLAKLILSSYDICEVISTGAGVAVPFLLAAANHDIPAHYIESATRSQGPSMSGKLLQLDRRVHLHTQSDAEGFSRRWHRLPSPFDQFVASERDRSGPIRNVLVSLGTHESYPFDRLIDRLASILPDDIEVAWQLGPTTERTALPGTVLTAEPPAQFNRRIEAADVIVAHAGTGIALTAMRAGKAPVLVPRRKAHGEHVDDHQLLTADAVASRGLGVVSEAGALVLADLERAAGIQISTVPGGPPSLHLVGRSAVRVLAP